VVLIGAGKCFFFAGGNIKLLQSAALPVCRC